ncbi:unnamed protein product [Closterium sp. Naga37s-1]|nr:unnamed protein product [Closterium sp. Naga37s-1]
MRDGIGCLRRGGVGRNEGSDWMSEKGSWKVDARVWIGKGSGRDGMGWGGLLVEGRVWFTVEMGLDVEEGVERVPGGDGIGCLCAGRGWFKGGDGMDAREGEGWFLLEGWDWTPRVCDRHVGAAVQFLAIERHERVLTKTSRTMTVGEPHDGAWSSYKLALGDEVMRRFSGELVRAGIGVSTLQVHTAVAIPPHTRMDTRDHGQLVKAAPDEHKFSHIRIQGGGAEWYSKLLILFQFTGPNGARVQRAFVKYYDEVSPPCPVTGCLRLVPTTGDDECSVIEVDCILALAHIVPSFTHSNILLVNRFLF